MLTEKLPLSLEKLAQNLPIEHLILVHKIRKQILVFSDEIGEMSKTTYTWYGAKKNDREIYKTKACALFKSVPLNKYPHLVLRLPYLRYKKDGRSRILVVDSAWAEVNIYGGNWIAILLDNPKSYRPSVNYKWPEYQAFVSNLLEKEVKLEAAEDFISLALEHWKWTMLTSNKPLKES